MSLARNLGTFATNVDSNGNIISVPATSITGSISATQMANTQSYTVGSLTADTVNTGNVKVGSWGGVGFGVFNSGSGIPRLYYDIGNSEGFYVRARTGSGLPLEAFMCRAWIQFNGKTQVINGSGNVSSITYYPASGYPTWVINFSDAMPDTNFAAVIGGSASASSGNNYIVPFSMHPYGSGVSSYRTTTSVAVMQPVPLGISQDCNVAIFR